MKSIKCKIALSFIAINLFAGNAFGQYGQSFGAAVAASQQRDIERQDALYRQQQYANQQQAESNQERQAELAVLFGKDPWRRIGNSTNLNRGDGWDEFQGQVQEICPGGIIFKGSYGAPLTIYTDTDGNGHITEKTYSSQEKWKQTKNSEQLSGRSVSDTSIRQSKIYGDDVFLVANFPYPAEQGRGYEKLMALSGDYYSYTNQSGQFITIPALNYGTPCAKVWTPEELEHMDKKKEAALRVLKSNEDAAANGDAYGLLRMGERYRDGDGVEKDLSKAKDYLTKAAAARSPTATDELKNLPLN